MRNLIQRVSSGVTGVWCRSMHPAPMWPIHNYYVCPRCQRQWPVPWVQQKNEDRQPATQENRVRHLHPAHRSL